MNLLQDYKLNYIRTGSKQPRPKKYLVGRIPQTLSLLDQYGCMEQPTTILDLLRLKDA